MKKFYFTEQTRQQEYGQKKTGTIYHMTKGELVKVGEYKYNTASCRGAKSEVMNAIIKNGALPQKYYGYYAPYDQNIFRIEQI